MFALGKPREKNMCNKIIADPVYPTFHGVYSKVDLVRAPGQDCSSGWCSLETCVLVKAASVHFPSQGGAITILTAAERPGLFSGMVLISPLVLASPESATTFKVSGFPVLCQSCTSGDPERPLIS